MAVYTRIRDFELRDAIYHLGLTLSGGAVGVNDGIENTTYFFNATDQRGETGKYVLTIIETIPEEQVHYSAALCGHLAAAGLPVPAPLRDTNGNDSFILGGKNALVFPRINGSHPDTIKVEHCQVIGEFLARAHNSVETFLPRLANNRGLTWMQDCLQPLVRYLNRSDLDLLHQQIESYQALCISGRKLPSGPIHGDLFTDNCLFEGTTLRGVIDFYNACNDWYLLDLAITVNDWCSIRGEAKLNAELVRRLVEAYHRIRPFAEQEISLWQPMLCVAATRFWVSRLMGSFLPQSSAGEIRNKNPEEFRLRLLDRLRYVPPLPMSN